MPDSTNEDGWQELRLPSRKECPKLFYSFHISKDSFSLLLTDLISIWDCSLDKYDVLAEAARQQASIDPSESTHQFGLLLSKLRESLQDGRNTLVCDNSPASQNLLLYTNISLPRPLKPLDWTFRLGQKNASELAEQLLRPSLHEVSVSQDKINSLLRIIKNKDHVISRLLDRIGTSAIDLGLIFPGIAGTSSRKGGQLSVADAKKHVAGMASFDEKTWIKQFSNDEGYEGADRTGLKNLVTGYEKCFVHTRQQHGDWLNGLATSDKVILRNASSQDQSQSSMGRTSKPVAKSAGDQSTESEDDFERQATPPNLQPNKSEPRSTSPAASDTHDEAETEDDEPSPKKAKTGKLGQLGRRNATKAYGDSKSRPKSSSSAAQAPSSPGHSSPDAAANSKAETDTASSTATQSDSEFDTAADRDRYERKKPRGHAKEPGKRKSKFGNLKRHQEQSLSSPSSGDESSARPTSKSKPKSRQNTRTPEPSTNTPLLAPSSSRRRLGRPNGAEETRKGKSVSSTPEAEDLDASPPPHTRSSQQRQPPAPGPPEAQATPPRRLGRLGGGRKPTVSSATASPQPPPSSSRKKAVRNSGEDVEMRDQNDDTRNTDADPDATPSPSPSRSGSPSTKPSTRQNPARSATTQLTMSPGRTQKPDLTKPAPATKQEEETPITEEETEQAKANRRREELKRSIASGAGVRKKRRF